MSKLAFAGAVLGGAMGYSRSEEDDHGFIKALNFGLGAAGGAFSGIAANRTLGVSRSYMRGVEAASKNTSDSIFAAAQHHLKNPAAGIGMGQGLAKKIEKAGDGSIYDKVRLGLEGAGYLGAVASPVAGAGWKGLKASKKEISSWYAKSTAESTTTGFKKSFTNPKSIAWAATTTTAGLGVAGVSLGSRAMSYSNPGKDKRRKTAIAINNQQEMAQADAIMMRAPTSMGMRDVDGAYDYSQGNRSSNQPMSRRQNQNYERMLHRSNRRKMEPGMFNDGGNLVFAMHDLRRG